MLYLAYLHICIVHLLCEVVVLLCTPCSSVGDVFDALVERLVGWAAAEDVAEPEAAAGTSAVGGFGDVSYVCAYGRFYWEIWCTLEDVHACAR